MTNIFLLGSTGSIGRQTLEIIASEPSNFRVKTLSCRKRIDILKGQIEKFKPEMVAVAYDQDKAALEKEFPIVKFVSGKAGLIEAATYGQTCDQDLVVNALVGVSGLEPTIAALASGRDVALANKETLVVGGDLVKKTASKTNSRIYPIDSEHSGLWQCLTNVDRSTIRNVYITASGGAFRDYARQELISVKPADALKHPNWQMGKKITIDSATMMNKGFEIIEACHLFDLPIDTVKPLMHKESLIHALVEFIDNSIIAQISSHDMRLAISYALHRGARVQNISQALDLEKISQLTFTPVDYERYPLLKIAIDAYKRGGSSTCVLNAANEAAVELFLNNKIAFLEIETIIISTLDSHQTLNNPSLDDLIRIDDEVKQEIFHKYGNR